MTTTSASLDADTREAGGGRPRDVDRTVVVLLFALVPVCFLPIVLGPFQATGLAWLAGLGLTARSLFNPVSPAVFRRVAPYLVFAFIAALSLSWSASARGISSWVQLLAPIPAFLLGAQLTDREGALRAAARAGQVAIALAAALVLADRAGLLPASLPLSVRPMAIALVPLFVVATLDTSRLRTAVLGAGAVGSAVLTGSRTAAVVLLVVVVLSPSWHVGRRGRVALVAAAALAFVAFSTTSAFRDRFFFNDDATLGDALTGSSALNTAGRRELWPQLVDECQQSTWFGRGVGEAGVLANDLTLGVLKHPHNDYLRMWCDVGLVGAVPFWLFFGLAGWQGLRLGRRGSPLGAASVQLVLGLALLALTDNVLIYTAYFMVPATLLLGCALGAAGSERDVRA
ncbi:MAG: hypothetical protein JWN88_2640 [Frankiales bacterium]|nr:hypothetical protein [Frankiales bacterium]